VRHSHATRSRLSVTSRHGNCQLEIEDNGLRTPDGAGDTERHAANPAKIESEGQGLLGMRERVSASGGTVSERSDGGTTLIIKLPLMPNPDPTLQ